jgi:hypothetical protein
MYESGSVALTSREVALDARMFVRSNLGWVWEAMKPILPYIIVFSLAGLAAEVYFPIDKHELKNYSKSYLLIGVAGPISVSFILSYFWACFAMSWHRIVLLGPRRENLVSPLSLPPGSRGFFLAFYFISLLPFLLGVSGGIIFGILAYFKVTALTVTGGLIGLSLIVLGVYKALQFSFLLPARSVGVNLTRAGAKKVSKGLLWTFVVASARATWRQALLSVLVIVLIILVASVVQFILKIGEHELELLANFLLFAPTFYFQAIFLALNVTLLSFLYQWSVQNRFKEKKKVSSEAGETPV